MICDPRSLHSERDMPRSDHSDIWPKFREFRRSKPSSGFLLFHLQNKSGANRSLKTGCQDSDKMARRDEVRHRASTPLLARYLTEVEVRSLISRPALGTGLAVN